MEFWRHLSAIMWKNYRYMYRRKFDTLIQFLLPMYFFVVLVQSNHTLMQNSVSLHNGSRWEVVSFKGELEGPFYLTEMPSSGFLATLKQQLVSPLIQLTMSYAHTPFPMYCRQLGVGFALLSLGIPLLVVVCWFQTAATITKSIVYEREKRLKEVMRTMGLANSIHWIAWFLQSFVLLFLSVVLISVLVLMKLGNVSALVQNMEPSLWVFFLSCFATATIAFSFLFSTFFSKANIASAITGILYMLLIIPSIAILLLEQQLSHAGKIFSCLLPHCALVWGCFYIQVYQESGVQLSWANIGATEEQFRIPLLMLMFDTVFYMLLAMYIDAVWPGEFGIPLKWYFPVQKSFWFTSYAVVDQSVPISSRGIEPVPDQLKLVISMMNLRKVYENGNVAIHGLSLNFYENQITSFLGDSGAGKTTTLSILTGMFPPTSGTAEILGNDIRKNPVAARKYVGMCPQHNVLLDSLTVAEQLTFYARLKGVISNEEINSQVDKVINRLGLVPKRNDMAETLSGVMQRKLSIGIAFIGGSKVVVLDEPTAGIDASARRDIWDLLLKYKEGHTIVVSTHQMDEAEILGDRIAIISKGRLQCCGSSLFVKKRLGIASAAVDDPVKKAAEEKYSKLADRMKSLLVDYERMRNRLTPLESENKDLKAKLDFVETKWEQEKESHAMCKEEFHRVTTQLSKAEEDLVFAQSSLLNQGQRAVAEALQNCQILHDEEIAAIRQQLAVLTEERDGCNAQLQLKLIENSNLLQRLAECKTKTAGQTPPSAQASSNFTADIHAPGVAVVPRKATAGAGRGRGKAAVAKQSMESPKAPWKH